MTVKRARQRWALRGGASTRGEGDGIKVTGRDAGSSCEKQDVTRYRGWRGEDGGEAWQGKERVTTAVMSHSPFREWNSTTSARAQGDGAVAMAAGVNAPFRLRAPRVFGPWLWWDGGWQLSDRADARGIERGGKVDESRRRAEAILHGVSWRRIYGRGRGEEGEILEERRERREG